MVHGLGARDQNLSSQSIDGRQYWVAVTMRRGRRMRRGSDGSSEGENWTTIAPRPFLTVGLILE